MAENELERIQKWGIIPPGGDFLGTWLANALLGKRDIFFRDKNGDRITDENDIKAPGTYVIDYDTKSTEQPFLDCVYDISLSWDQWARCTIRCSHGTFSRDSDFLNLTEAVIRAIVAFNEADHPNEEDSNDRPVASEA